MKLAAVVIGLGLVLVVQGCQWVNMGCALTTEETRAEIREKQKVKTDICGDLR